MDYKYKIMCHITANKYSSIKDFCEANDIKYYYFYQRLTGAVPFSIQDARKLKELLHLTMDDVEEIFFS